MWMRGIIAYNHLRDITAATNIDGEEIGGLSGSNAWIIGKFISCVTGVYACQIAVLYVKHRILTGKEGEGVAGGGFCVQHINGHIDNPQNLNGTFHNGVKISHPKNGVRVPVLLENGDILLIDNFLVRQWKIRLDIYISDDIIV